MGSGQAYVGSALSILKLFAVKVWLMRSAAAKSQAEQIILHTCQQFNFTGAETNISHFCKFKLLASLTCVIRVRDKRGEQKRKDERKCGGDYHSTAPQRDTRGGCCITNVSEAVMTKRGRDGGRKGEKCSCSFFRFLASDVDIR